MQNDACNGIESFLSGLYTFNTLSHLLLPQSRALAFDVVEDDDAWMDAWPGAL